MPGAPRFGTVTHIAGTTHLGVNFNENFGVSVASAGDVNNDGVPDLIIGANLDDVGGMNRGSARVVSGANGATLYTFLGDAVGDFFGHSVAGAGDLNGDGFDDLLVGAYVADPNGSESGFARVLSGADGSILRTFNGDAVGDRMGTSVASAGDVDGDGVSDVIVGASLDDNTGTNAGSARVFSGATGAILYTFNGLAAADQLGSAVASAGDVDGDGLADLIIGSSQTDSPGANSGMAQVFSGATGALLHTFTGAASGDQFGISVASLGDIDGDGLADLAVGANLDDDMGSNSGSVTAFSGATRAVLWSIDGSGAGDQFGVSVANAGDVDGDGVDDLIVGAPEDNATAGSARLVSGATGGTIATFNGDDSDDNFGFAVSSAGDLNGDGLADVIVGADDDETNGAISGAARIFLSQLTNTFGGSPLAFTENAAPVLLDADVSLADAELDFANSYAGATLTLSRVGGAHPEDVFAGSGAVSLTGGNLIVSGIVTGTYVQADGELVISFAQAATSALSDGVLRALTYANASHTPPASVDIQVVFNDGDPLLPQSASVTVTVGITAVEDPPLAFDDAVAAAETEVLAGSVFADNGFGADVDFDGPPIAVGQVNGSIGAVGQPVVLASGAVLTLNADGTFTYDPGNLFEALGGPLSGAANTTFSESFTYALTTGETATVTVTVNGVDGADILFGTVGADIINAGIDEDRVLGSAGNDSLDGGAGIDVLSYAEVAAGVSVNLAAGRTANDGQGGVDLLAGFENLVGSAFNDILIGSTGGNIISGGAGTDVLLGLGGADILIGGAGAADQLQGGAGDDQYFVVANDTIVELAGEGRDRVFVDRAVYSLGANIEDLTYNGVGAFTGRGNALANVIIGGVGTDVLVGGGGQDTLQGGDGVDLVDYFTAAGAVVADLGLGTATDDGDGSNDLLQGVEGLRGSAFGDQLSGDAGANRLEGAGGADVLAGRGGNDTLLGAGGVDTATYASAAAGIAASLQNGAVTNDGDGGADTVDSIENLIGSAFNDVLIGSAAGNALGGGAGRDTLVGLAGNDTLSGGLGLANQLFGGTGDDVYVLEAVGDTISEAAGQGTDTARVAFNQFTLAANVENAVYIGAGNFAVTGNALANVITGGAGSDTLTGGAGNDTLNGGLGRDVVRLSGASADYIFVDLGDGRIRIADRVAGRDGVDILVGIEAARFSDGVVLDVPLPAAASVADGDFLAEGDLSAKETGPDVLPALVDDAFVTLKGVDQPQVLPATFDGVDSLAEAVDTPLPFGWAPDQMLTVDQAGVAVTFDDHARHGSDDWLV